MRDSKLTRLKGSRSTTGGYRRNKDKQFTTRRLKIEPGDSFYLFTDGIYHQIGGDDNQTYKRTRFLELLQWLCNMSVTEQRDSLNKVFSGWAGSNAQTDDILVMSFRIL